MCPRRDDPPRRCDGPEMDPAAPVELPIEDALDLHAFRARDIRDVVNEYLWEAARAGLSEVRIIHGKGIGVQRRIVASLLEQHPAVVSFQGASADRGHYGATLVRLRNIKRSLPPADQRD